MTDKLLTIPVQAGAAAPSRWRTLDDLPPVVDLVTAARLLGIGRTTAYQLVRAGGWPTRVLRLGRQIRIPTAQLMEFVGACGQDGSVTHAPPAPRTVADEAATPAPGG